MCFCLFYLQHPDMHRAAFVARVRDVTYDATVDLWSFGITIYQCATGCMAFEPNSGIRVNKRKMWVNILVNRPPSILIWIDILLIIHFWYRCIFIHDLSYHCIPRTNVLGGGGGGILKKKGYYMFGLVVVTPPRPHFIVYVIS